MTLSAGMLCLSSSAFKIPQYWLALFYISVFLIFLFLSEFLPHCLLVSVSPFSLVSVFRLSVLFAFSPVDQAGAFDFFGFSWISLDLTCNLVILHQVSPLQSGQPLFHQPFGKGSERRCLLLSMVSVKPKLKTSFCSCENFKFHNWNPNCLCLSVLGRRGGLLLSCQCPAGGWGVCGCWTENRGFWGLADALGRVGLRAPEGNLMPQK